MVTRDDDIRKKIMIVDDDPDILVSIRKIFEREVYEVFTVDSGMDCIKELERGFKGVVLMDIMMPFMDGWDIIDEINKRGLLKHSNLFSYC
jgi:CheY-like chemotaxis protein